MRRVVITGAGLISSLGDRPALLQAALCEGRSGLRAIEAFDSNGLRCRICGAVSSFSATKYLGEKNLRPLDRTSQMVASAAKLALDDSRWSEDLRREREVGLALGTMFCSVHTISEFDRRALRAGPAYASPLDFSNTVINAAAGQTAIRHSLRGPNSTIAAGSASGLQAIIYASEMIRTRRAEAILAGGADEMCFESFLGFHQAGLLCGSGHLPEKVDSSGDHPIPFDRRRNGFALGEGAALLMLEEKEAALARGARVLAEIAGHASLFDTSRGKEETRAVETIAHAMRLALRDAQLTTEEIDCMSLSANGSPQRDRQEARAAGRLLGGRAKGLPVTAIKSMLGETLGASGAFQAVAMIESLRGGVLPGIAQLEEPDPDFPLEAATSRNRKGEFSNGLISTIGIDGNCCAAVIARA
jgi:3-oxoacyl-[acyl-carrier-protein] synthase II